MGETLKFIPDAQPALEEGRYCVTVSQTTNIGCKIADASLEFQVAAEQLNLPPNEVYSLYPPSMSSGIFGDCIPHIVLKRKTLPWERKLPGLPANTPWMTLLVFSEEEGVLGRSLSYKEAVDAPEDTYVPQLNRDFASDDEPCFAIDIPAKLFAEIIPLKDELALLAHVRKVSLDNKVTDPSVDEGCFACVVANRYPDRPKTLDGEYRKHTAYLVSLEGFGDYIAGNRLSHEIFSCEAVRMFALASWSFSVQKEPFDFVTLAEKLSASAFGFDASKEEYPLTQQQVNLGYYPVEHQFREGSVSVSWYRSPLLRNKGGGEEIPLCKYSDQLLRYDPETGMFDISLSAAWQLGRLLCLQKKDLPNEIMRWRNWIKERAVRRSNGLKVSERLEQGNAAARLKSGREDDVKERCRDEWLILVRALSGAICIDDDRG